MKKFTKMIALILSLTLILCFPIGVSAAELEDTGADTAAKGSLTIYKVDMTNAEKDGVWNSSYVSTGVYDQNVNDTLNSYALKDVEFTYLRVADVVQLTGFAAEGVDFDHVETLYGISKTAGADLLNGAKYCHQSPTMDEEPLQQAIMSAINSVMDSKGIICSQITEAAVEETGILPDSTMTLGEINRRLEELEAEFNILLQQPDSAAKNAERFGSIANEMASLKEQREKIAAGLRKDQAVQAHVHTMEEALDGMSHRMQQWDEEMIRQLVHTVKVISADHIKVYLYDGTEIDQAVSP